MHHDAEKADPEIADRDHLRLRQTIAERVRIGIEPRAAKFGDAFLQLRGRNVVFVIAEDHVGDPGLVEAIDHPRAEIEAREHARREKITGQDGEKCVGWIFFAPRFDERREPREILESVDVVDGDDTQARHGAPIVACLALDSQTIAS